MKTEGSTRQLIFGYLDTDPDMKPSEILRRLKSDHGMDVPEGSASSARFAYKNRGPKKSKPVLNGVHTSIKELVERYVLQDNSLSSPQIQERLLADHGIKANKRTVVNSVYEAKKHYGNRNGHVKSLHTPTAHPTVSVEALRLFFASVKTIGGPRVAASILSAIEG